ncbi:MAG: ABC transporter ATP-binding protein [Burkholderiaceae bacterium]|nr:ABC transporter ATP-binding protein [Burkholderiaceae bacterium]
MPLLEIDRVEAGYGAIRALFGVSLALEAGRTLALIGANGAGKSTLLRAITGLTAPGAGRVRFDGADLTGMPAHAIAARGIALVPEGRRLFASLTVEENLLMGASAARAGPWNLQTVYALFPDLVARRQHGATMLSGGQQQMVAIGRALMANPRLLLCDELSLGLAPVVVRGLYGALAQVSAQGVALVVVEQDIGQALAASDDWLCLREGEVVLAGTRGQADRGAIARAYFGSEAA